MMRTSYDPDADAFYAQFGPESTRTAETREILPGIMVDLDADGHAIGIEVLGIHLRAAGLYRTAVAHAARSAAAPYVGIET